MGVLSRALAQEVWGFLEFSTLFEVPIIKTLVFWGLYEDFEGIAFVGVPLVRETAIFRESPSSCPAETEAKDVAPACLLSLAGVGR